MRLGLLSCIPISRYEQTMLQVVACPRKISDTRNKAGHNQNLEPRTVEFWLDQSTQMCNKGEKMLIMLAIK